VNGLVTEWRPVLAEYERLRVERAERDPML
jgi:hypothetical protein